MRLDPRRGPHDTGVDHERCLRAAAGGSGFGAGIEDYGSHRPGYIFSPIGHQSDALLLARRGHDRLEVEVLALVPLVYVLLCIRSQFKTDPRREGAQRLDRRRHHLR